MATTSKPGEFTGNGVVASKGDVAENKAAVNKGAATRTSENWAAANKAIATRTNENKVAENKTAATRMRKMQPRRERRILLFVLRLQRMRNPPLAPRLHLSARLARRALLIR